MNKPILVTDGLQRTFGGVGNPHIDIWMKKGLEMLKKPNKEDSPNFKLRVVDERHKIWIIEDGQAITLLESKDY